MFLLITLLYSIINSSLSHNIWMSLNLIFLLPLLTSGGKEWLHVSILGQDIDNKLNWKTNTEAVYKNRMSRLHFFSGGDFLSLSCGEHNVLCCVPQGEQTDSVIGCQLDTFEGTKVLSFLFLDNLDHLLWHHLLVRQLSSFSDSAPWCSPPLTTTWIVHLDIQKQD